MPSTRKKGFLKTPGFRLGLIATSALILLALACFSFWFTARALFTANEHFTLRRVIVKSGGWWKSHKNEVNKSLNITTGKTNLFSIDMAKGKKILEKKPSISKASIYKILPDTLIVKISERLPRAFLHWQGHSNVVDTNSVVMAAASCISVPKDLPVITGFRSKPADLIPGKILYQIKPALALIKNANEECPRILIRRVSLSNPKEFNTNIVDRKTMKNYNVMLLRNNILEELAALESVLGAIDAGKGKNTKIIDMRFKGQAVLK